MSDNTTLNNGTGGDIIRTDESIDRSTGTAVSVKTQVIKLATGRANVDGGLVDSFNPLWVEDVKVRKLLEKISSQLGELLEAIKRL